MKLGRAALRIAYDDKKIFGLAALSSLVSLLITAGAIAAVIVFWATAKSMFLAGIPQWYYYVGAAVIGLVVYYLGSLFNAALTYVALRRFDGERVSFQQALGAAIRKSSPLLGLAGLTVTIGAILRLIGDTVPYVGWGATWLGGIAWNIASIFTVQVIMNDDETNPIEAVKRSSKTFTDIWKESVFIGVSLGLISIIATSVLMVLVLGLLVLSAVFGTITLAVIALTLLVVVTIALAVISTALRAVILSAAYYYATKGHAPTGFDDELLRKAFRPKKKWLNV